MKVILTEEQYKILETILNEVSKNNFTNTIEVGSIINIIQGDDFIEKFKVINILVTDKIIEAIDERREESHLFLLDSALNLTDNTFFTIKNGTFDKKNRRIIKDDGEESIIEYVKRVEVYSPSGELVDTVYTKLGKKDSEKSDADSEAEFEKQLAKDNAAQKEMERRKKDVYNMVMNDPLLKQTFYNQPTLFAGLLNFGKAKGVVPARNLIDKYIKGFNDEKQKEEGDFKKFKVNNNVIYEIMSKPIRLSYGEQQFERKVGEKYKARYVGDQYLKGSSGSGGKAGDKVDYKIYLNEKAGEDIYRGSIKAFFSEGDTEIDKMDNVVIKIWDYKR